MKLPRTDKRRVEDKILANSHGNENEWRKNVWLVRRRRRPKVMEWLVEKRCRAWERDTDEWRLEERWMAWWTSSANKKYGRGGGELRSRRILLTLTTMEWNCRWRTPWSLSFSLSPRLFVVTLVVCLFFPSSFFFSFFSFFLLFFSLRLGVLISRQRQMDVAGANFSNFQIVLSLANARQRLWTFITRFRSKKKKKNLPLLFDSSFFSREKETRKANPWRTGLLPVVTFRAKNS